MAWRVYRNVEASLIEYLEAQLVADSWSGVRVEKVFSKAYDGTLPCIVVGIRTSPLIERREIGTTNLIEHISVDFRIFGTDDGNRLDLAAWLIDKLKIDIDYYVYSGTGSTKTLTGKIVSEKFTDNRKELANTEILAKEDRFRHIVSLTCRVTT